MDRPLLCSRAITRLCIHCSRGRRFSARGDRRGPRAKSFVLQRHTRPLAVWLDLQRQLLLSFLIFTRLRACTHVSVTRPQCLLMVLVHPLVGSAESITTHFSWDQPRLVEPCARSYPLGLQSSPRRRCGSSTMAVRPLSGPSTCMAETASHRQTPCSALLKTLNPHTLSACASRTRRRCTATSRTYRRHSWRTRRSCEGRLCRRYVHD